MGYPQQIKEDQLYTIWASGNFNNPLKLNKETEIEIVNRGDHNSDEAGPDFQNAKIRIGNFTYQGDIEIDVDYQDWKRNS